MLQYLFCEDDARTVAIRQNELRVKHKKGRATNTQLVILYRHQIIFFEHIAGSNKQSVVDKYFCALCSNLQLDSKDKKVLCFDVNNLGTTTNVRIQW